MLKKILYINLTAKNSGAEFCLLRLMAGLDKKKYQPVLLLPESGVFMEKAETLGIETIILPNLIRFGEYFHWWKIPKAVLAVFQLRKIIRSREIALVHCNTTRAAYIGGLTAWLAKTPLLIHVRDIEFSPFAVKYKSRLLGYLSDRIVAVSKAVAHSILKVNPALHAKTDVVYDGFDVGFIASTARKDIRDEKGWPAAVKLVGAVGIIHPHKGQDILIRAARRLKPLVPELKLLLIGEVFHHDAEGYLQSLKQLACELGIGDNVVFSGFRTDVLSWIRDLDVFVHPATIPDSLPGVLIEAAALGKAIVAARVGGVAEIVEHEKSALLVDPGDEDALAAAVLSLLSDPGKAERLSRQARQRAISLFGIRHHVESISKIYEELFAGS